MGLESKGKHTQAHIHTPETANCYSSCPEKNEGGRETDREERGKEGGREERREGNSHVRSHVTGREKKSGQRLQGEGLERSRVCSVYEETGQGVRLRNSLQWLSQRHVDHHVLPPSSPPLLTLTPLSAHCLSSPPLPPPCIVSVCCILPPCPSYFSPSLSPLVPPRPGSLFSPGHARSAVRAAQGRSAAVTQYRDVLAPAAALGLF